jgi:hypothetical protein
MVRTMADRQIPYETRGKPLPEGLRIRLRRLIDCIPEPDLLSALELSPAALYRALASLPIRPGTCAQIEARLPAIEARITH